MTKIFQHVINIKNINEIILNKTSVFSLRNLVCFTLRAHDSSDGHISSTQWPHAARESCIKQHNYRAFGKYRKVNGNYV